MGPFNVDECLSLSGNGLVHPVENALQFFVLLVEFINQQEQPSYAACAMMHVAKCAGAAMVARNVIAAIV